jgi:peptide/nickel transport system ATP-binding protein
MTHPALSVEGLHVDYRTKGGQVHSLDGVDLTVAPGEVVGIVGESGSGKSTLASCIGGLLAGNGERSAGDLRVAGTSVFASSPAGLRDMRRSTVGFVFQNPISSLDPTMRVGRQIAQATDLNAAGIAELLDTVGLPDAERVSHSFPHQLSGGMAQRVAIAMAVARNPQLLVADEPTSALDRSVQERILALLVDLSRNAGNALVIFTHDLRAVEAWCDRTVVMYGGRIVEEASTKDLFAHPAHPYTRGLLDAAVSVDDSKEAGLRPVPGSPPVLCTRSTSCSFAPRCPMAVDQCREERPEPRELQEHHVVCFRAEEVLDERA